MAGEADQPASFEEWQQRVHGTNISPATLLATDYLNHFNEIIMLLGLLPDMPELIEECRAWQPKDYRTHFRDSGLSDRGLAIRAYAHVPPRYRKPFEETVGQMNSVVQGCLDQSADAVVAGEGQLARLRTQAAVELLQRLLDCASAIIHGAEVTLHQDEIDALLGR